jgi:NAD(P)-dependent dehydrogenase (short-subunit alcohol dehydrogenase family)
MAAAWVDGKVVVVTGGASGIGAALCRGFARAGAHMVVVVDMNEAEAQKVADEVGGLAIRANCGVEMDLRRVIMRVEFEVGAIDIWLSNAGIPSNGGLDVPNDEWVRGAVAAVRPRLARRVARSPL